MEKRKTDLFIYLYRQIQEKKGKWVEKDRGIKTVRENTDKNRERERKLSENYSKRDRKRYGKVKREGVRVVEYGIRERETKRERKRKREIEG